MKRFSVALISTLFFSPIAFAERDPAFVDTDEAACQKEIGLRAGQHFAKAFTLWRKCYDAEGKGKGDCAGIDLVQARLGFQDRVDRRCGDLATFDKLGLGSDVVAAVDALADALEFQAGALSDRVFLTLYGGGDVPLKDIDRNRYLCARSLGSEAGKLVRNRTKTDSALCLDKDDKQQAKDPTKLPKCDEAKRADKAVSNDIKAALRIERRCDADELIAATGEMDPAAVASGFSGVARSLICASYPNSGNADVCPTVTTIGLRVLSGDAAVGYTGEGHGSEVEETLEREIELVDCVGSGPRTCDLRAEVTGEVDTVSPSDAGGVATCIVSAHTADIGGTLSFHGAVDVIEHLELVEPRELQVHLGASLSAPCPVCSGAGLGDAGTCAGGPDDGNPCTVELVTSLGNTSSDCLPPAGARIDTIRSEPADAIATTGAVSLPAIHDCAFAAAGACPCEGQTFPNTCTGFFCDDSVGTCFNGSTIVGCFPNSIYREGATFPLELVSVSCSTSISPAVQTVLGIPGPIVGRKVLELRALTP